MTPMIMNAQQAKADAQFFVAIVSIIALAVITGSAIGIDVWHGTQSQMTGMLAGGLISVCSACSSWLYRNGNGNGETGTEPSPARTE